MSRTPKISHLRLVARKISEASRRFPAWIDGDTRPVGLTVVAGPRVRAALVLRLVARGKNLHLRNLSDARSAS
jgi:hypothetical protein